MSDLTVQQAEARFDAIGDFNDWCESNQALILEQYCESLEFEDLPDAVKAEIATDDVEVWQMMLEKHIDNLTYKDVPDEFCSDMYETMMDCGDRE